MWRIITRKRAFFLGSGFDGIGQQYLVIPAENVVKIPAGVPDEIAVLAELSSVGLRALEHVKSSLDKGKIAVFGDGPVGYLTAAMLSVVYQVPKERLVVFGAIAEKLTQFEFAETHLVQEFDFSQKIGVQTIVECTGGAFSEGAINQAIQVIDLKVRLS